MSEHRPKDGYGPRTDAHNLRVMFMLIPWRMRPRLIALAAVTVFSSMLDILAVVLMLPLTQMLTSGGEIPSVARQYLVPFLGTEDSQRVLLALAAVVGGAFLVKNGVLILIRWWAIGLVQRAQSEVQISLLEMYLSVDYQSHRKTSKAAVQNNIVKAGPEGLNNVLLGYVSFAVDAVTVAVLMLTLLTLSPVGFIAAVVIFGGSGWLLARVIKPFALKHAHDLYLLDQGAMSYINPAIEGFREAKIFRREAYFTDGFAVNRREAASKRQPQMFFAELPKYLLEVVLILGILVVAVILFATDSADTAFGLLAVFAAAAMRIVPALNRMVANLNNVRAGEPNLEMVAREVEKLREQRQEDFRAEPAVDFPAEAVVVRDLGFHYADDDREVLHGVNARIEPGRSVALVGASGAGKTTFADLLAGLYQPTRGSITVGGVDLSGNMRDWRRKVAMVSQRVYLWDTTLRDLITFGQARQDVDEQLLQEVIRRARLEDLVASLPEGLDTMVGDTGSRLSGGQAQRVGIARALYSQPDVLILDEATSALDNQTEHEITQTIEALHGNITVITIAHRLSTVKNADEILFFSHGTLKGRGSMAELVESEPEFARLVELGRLT